MTRLDEDLWGPEPSPFVVWRARTRLWWHWRWRALLRWYFCHPRFYGHEPKIAPPDDTYPVGYVYCGRCGYQQGLDGRWR